MNYQRPLEELKLMKIISKSFGKVLEYFLKQYPYYRELRPQYFSALRKLNIFINIIENNCFYQELAVFIIGSQLAQIISHPEFGWLNYYRISTKLFCIIYKNRDPQAITHFLINWQIYSFCNFQRYHQ